MRRSLYCLGLAFTLVTFGSAAVTRADDFQLRLRTIATKADGASERPLADAVTWQPHETAVILCDVWDYHHSINAVRRLDEMLPRMNQFLAVARKSGATIIHAPSDCMPAYEQHAARLRTLAVPKPKLPADVASWCSLSRVEGERGPLAYPIDQSDGGEDDDPQEHREWAEKLRKLGRNPGMPWKAQSPAIAIDSGSDYISDRGDEVWGILQQHQIKHVILLGVHANMCVLGRPFGLRRLAQENLDVVLVRDLTDSMYNPQRWPYVDHFSGNDLVVAYVEKFVCPTITSDQILGGSPLQFRGDHRAIRDIVAVNPSKPAEWQIHRIKAAETSIPALVTSDAEGAGKNSLWLRCSIRFPSGTLDQPAQLIAPAVVQAAWLNGQPLKQTIADKDQAVFEIEKKATFGNDDANLLVLRFAIVGPSLTIPFAPKVRSIVSEKELSGKWEAKYGASESATNIPLPAKFGMSPEVFYTLP